jgi:hypothetical protein
MHRRLLIALPAACAAARLFAQEGDQAHRKVSAPELRRALMARFPVRIAVPGLFDVRLDADRLVLLPARQRMGATLLATATELASGRAYPADMDLTFAVRYEPADQTLRAHQLEVLGLHSPALRGDAVLALQALLDGVARNAVDELVLHRFSPAELALPDVLGLRPDRITIESDGVEIWFAPKAPR